MTKADFLQALKEKIADLPYSEVIKTLEFYSEAIDDRIEDGISEVDAVSGIGDIGSIVSEMQTALPLGTLIGNRIGESKRKAKSPTHWIILALCGFPIWFSLGMAFVAVILSVYVSIWAVIVSLFAAVASLGIVGAAGIIGGTIRCFTATPLSGIMLIGTSLMSLGLCVLSVKPMLWITKKLVLVTGLFLKWVKRLFIKKEVA